MTVGMQTTIYLRADELTAIQKQMSELQMKRHELIKFALRRFLFPEESTVPLNGRHAHVGDMENGHRIFILANGDGGKPE
jgi:hypothetical protein